MSVIYSPIRSPIRSPIYSAFGSGPSYDLDAIALFERFTTPADDTRKGLINDLIVALKAGGVWSKLDALYVMAAHDAQAARRNWIADQYNLTAVSSPTFTTDRGYAGDGASSYLTTAAAPNSGLANLTLNSAHVSTYGNTAEGANSGGTIGCGAGTSAILLYPRLATNFSGSLNSSTALTAANATTQGLFVINRSGASASELYIGSSQVATGTPAAGLLNGNPIDILRRNPNYYTGRLAAASFGGSLSSGEVTALHTALSTYLQAVGAA